MVGKMNVLLISVPTIRIRYNISGVFPLPPLGLAYIAAILKNSGFAVEILDMDVLRIKLSDLSSRLKGCDYPVVGVSCRSIFSLGDAIRIIKEIKSVLPGSTVIGGGPGFMFSPEIIFKHMPGCDIIVHGEGEDTMLNLCSRLKTGNKDLSGLEGISYRSGGQVISRPRQYYLDLDKLPLPARTLLPNNRYRMHPPFGVYPPATLMETSRGCEYGCTFCSLRRPVKGRSAHQVIDEIQGLIREYGVKEIQFIDPNFTYDQKRVMDLCRQLIDRKIKVSWTCKTRIDLVSEELLKTMSQAGCYMISYGVESGSQKILDTLDKGITVEEAERVFRLTRQAKIKTLAYVIIGSPGEDDNTVKQTTDFLIKLKADFVLFGELLPGLNSILVKQTIGEKMFSEEDLFDFYVFGKNIFDKDNFNHISQVKIKKWLIMAYKSFYLRPGYFIQCLMKLRNAQELVCLAKGACLLFLDTFKKKSKVF